MANKKETKLMEQSEYKSLVQSVLDDINRKFLERDELTRILTLTIFAQSHIFLIGKPGVGKTDIVSTIGSVITGGNFWELVVNAETKVEQYYGDPKIPYAERDLKSTVLGNEIVFLDELFKASDDTNNALLPFLNERKYQEGGVAYPVKLITMVGASNEMPTGDKIAPFDDRLIFRYEVLRIQKSENAIKFYKKDFVQDRTMKATATLEDIRQVNNGAKSIYNDDEFWTNFDTLKKKILKSGIEMSDRKIGKALDILRAAAWMNNRNSLNLSDFFILNHIAWSKIEDKKTIRRITNEFAFSSIDEISFVLKESEDKLISLSALISENLSDFINYSFTEAQFGTKLRFMFDSVKDVTIQSVLHEIELVEAPFFYVHKKHERAFAIAAEVEENIFVSNVKDRTFTEETIARYTQGLNTLNHYRKTIVEWDNANSDCYDFEMKCRERTQRGVA